MHLARRPLQHGNRPIHKRQHLPLIQGHSIRILRGNLEQKDNRKGNHRIKAQRQTIQQRLQLRISRHNAQYRRRTEHSCIRDLFHLRTREPTLGKIRRGLRLRLRLRLRAPKRMRAQIQLRKVEVQSHAFRWVIAHPRIRAKAIAPVRVPGIQRDGEAAQLGEFGRRDGRLDVYAEGIEDGRGDEPDFHLRDESHVVFGCVFGFEE